MPVKPDNVLVQKTDGDQLDSNLTHASVMDGILVDGNKLLQTRVIYKSPKAIALPFELLHYRIQLQDKTVASVLLYEMSQMTSLDNRQDASRAFDEIVVAANSVPQILNGDAKIDDGEPLYSIFNLSASMSGADFFSQVIWKMHTFPEEVTNRLSHTFIITNSPASPRSFLLKLALRMTRNTQVVANLPEALSLVRGARY